MIFKIRNLFYCKKSKIYIRPVFSITKLFSFFIQFGYKSFCFCNFIINHFYNFFCVINKFFFYSRFSNCTVLF